MINFDAPGDQDAYTHRIGRTGRAGNRGAGISFVLEDQVGEMRRIARDLGLSREFDLGRPAGSAQPRPRPPAPTPTRTAQRQRQRLRRAEAAPTPSSQPDKGGRMSTATRRKPRRSGPATSAASRSAQMDGGRVRFPETWDSGKDGPFCLNCRRDRAAQAALESAPDDSPIEVRAKLRRAALIEFEVSRRPDHGDGAIAKACRSSVSAVAAARQRLKLPAPEQPCKRRQRSDPGRPPSGLGVVLALAGRAGSRVRRRSSPSRSPDPRRGSRG